MGKDHCLRHLLSARITKGENSCGGKCRSVRGHRACLWPRVSSHLEACGEKPGGPCVAVFCVIGIGTGGSGGAKTLLIFIHAVETAVYYVTCMLHAHGTCISKVLTRRFVKSSFCIGCVGVESNATVDSNPGEPTSGIDYFGAKNGTSVESSTGDLSRPVVLLL